MVIFEHYKIRKIDVRQIYKNKKMNLDFKWIVVHNENILTLHSNNLLYLSTIVAISIAHLDRA